MTKKHLEKHKLIHKIETANVFNKLSKNQRHKVLRYGKVPNLGNNQFSKEEIQRLIQAIEAKHRDASVLKKRLEDMAVETREENQRLIREIEAATVLRKNQPLSEEDKTLYELPNWRPWPEVPGSYETGKRR